MGARERVRPLRAAAMRLCVARVLVALGILAVLLLRPAAAQNLADTGVSDSGSLTAAERRSAAVEKTAPESEISVDGLGSFGHFHIFANSWWSYLDLAQVEYDRHAWGHALGARMDYSAAFAPMVLLRQPSVTDVWGNPHSTSHELVYGIGFAPIGLRMTWRSHKDVKPYFLMRGGGLLFDKKAVSQYASYYNWSLQMGFGVQFKVAPRWDARAGFSDYHFSDAFMVPSNPGLDSMMYTCGLVYRLGGARVR
jgi:hypothetical protein